MTPQNQIQRSLDFVESSSDFVELKAGPLWELDLRYASSNNFVGVNMYGRFNRAFLHRRCEEQLRTAVERLQKTKPGHRFLIYDALRPRSVQRILWKHVVGTQSERYIANPDKGSLHNFGFAVDLTVIDQGGSALDMGAGYDDFRDIAQPQFESRFHSMGQLSDLHLKNRRLLREVMESTGFQQLPHEWWHFDALTRDEAKSRFMIVE
jgi:D-alanyl-D-alanine dipeptidase